MSAGSQQLPAAGSIPYTRLMAVVTKYLSVRTAITLVNKSLIEIGLTPESMVTSDLPEVIEATMSSLRAFVPEAQMQDLVLDLSALSSIRAQSEATARPRSHSELTSEAAARLEADAPLGSPSASRRPSQFPPTMPAPESSLLSSRRRR